VFWVFKNGQKKCPKLKTKNTFWKKLVQKMGCDENALNFKKQYFIL
jgi:hypothetical protein